MSTKQVDPCWGKPYGGAQNIRTDEGVLVTMYRNRCRVRFYDANGQQVGPEQSNVAPAIAAAMQAGWCLDVAEDTSRRTS